MSIETIVSEIAAFSDSAEGKTYEKHLHLGDWSITIVVKHDINVIASIYVDAKRKIGNVITRDLWWDDSFTTIYDSFKNWKSVARRRIQATLEWVWDRH